MSQSALLLARVMLQLKSIICQTNHYYPVRFCCPNSASESRSSSHQSLVRIFNEVFFTSMSQFDRYLGRPIDWIVVVPRSRPFCVFLSSVAPLVHVVDGDHAIPNESVSFLSLTNKSLGRQRHVEAWSIGSPIVRGRRSCSRQCVRCVRMCG